MFRSLSLVLGGLAVLLTAAPSRADAPLWSGVRFGRLMAPAVTDTATLRLAGDGGFGRVAGRAAFAGRFGLGLAVPLPANLTLEAMTTVLEGSRASSTFGAVGDSRVHLARAVGPVTAAVGVDLLLADGIDGLAASSPWLGALWQLGPWRAAGSVRLDRSDELAPLAEVARWAEGLHAGWVLQAGAGRRVGPFEAAAAWRFTLPADLADRRDIVALDAAWAKALPVGRLQLGGWFETPGMAAPDGRVWTLGARIGLDLALRPLGRELFPPAVEAEPAFSPFGVE
jgi:hypothetical protein